MGSYAEGGGAEKARPIDAMLAGYVAGALDPYLHALIGAHLMLSDENRSFVRALEAEAGAAVEAIDAPKPARAARDHILSAIYAGGYYGRGAPVQRDPEVPEPLYRLINQSLDDLPWKLKLPGLREHVLSDVDGAEASFLKISAGQAMPTHTHSGSEVTLVLRGAFSDGRARYARGDVAAADPSVDHRPIADSAGECICFAVTDGPVRLTGPIGRVIERLFRT